jgi:protein-L-isoaspartate(D-aspartate) O-methyltransferase
VRPGTLRRRLVDELGIADARVRDAFLRVPREPFVPAFAAEHGLEAVYRDEPIVTKTDEHGLPISSSSQPGIMATMLERLALAPGLRVLEIGAGTGYNAALLKTIVGPRGRVVSVDVDPELAQSARSALRRGGFAVRVVCGEGRVGYAPGAPYDRVIATVSSPFVPRTWRDQLVDGGLLELPLQLGRADVQVVVTFRRDGDRLESVAVVHGGFMPLRGLPRDASPALVATAAGEPIAELRGPALAALSGAARRRLLVAALGKPRRVRLDRALPRWSLALWLALELPGTRLVWSVRHGIGVAGRGGHGLALADVAWSPGAPDTTRSLLVFGEGDAEEHLLRAIERWRSLGTPDAAALELGVEFVGSDSLISRSWRRG